PHRPRRPLRRVRHVRRQQEDLALADRDRPVLAVLDHLELYVALELVEELLALVEVVVLPRVRTADHHDDEVLVAVLEDLRVADRRLEEAPVLVDPPHEVDGGEGHGASSLLLMLGAWPRRPQLTEPAARPRPRASR